MQDEQLLDMFKQVGPAGMSPAALQRVMAIPGAADVLGPQIQQLGDERSAGVRERLAGMSPADVGDQMRKPLSDQRDDVRTLLASAAQDEAHQRSGIASEFASAVTDALRGLMDEAIDMIRRENKTDVNNKILFNNGN